MFGRRKGGYVLDLTEVGREMGRKGKGRDRKVKVLPIEKRNKKLLDKFTLERDKEMLEELLNNTEIEDRELHTSDSLLSFMKHKYGKKKNGKEFTSDDIYQYVYRGNLPIQYGGHSLEVIKKTQGILVIKIGKEGDAGTPKKGGRAKKVVLKGITDED